MMTPGRTSLVRLPGWWTLEPERSLLWPQNVHPSPESAAATMAHLRDVSLFTIKENLMRTRRSG